MFPKWLPDVLPFFRMYLVKQKTARKYRSDATWGLSRVHYPKKSNISIVYPTATAKAKTASVMLLYILKSCPSSTGNYYNRVYIRVILGFILG